MKSVISVARSFETLKVLLMAALIVAAGCGSAGHTTEAVVGSKSEAVTVPVTDDQSRIFGFEDLADWTQVSGSAGLAISTEHVDAAHSLELTGVTSSKLKSASFASFPNGFSSIDIWVQNLTPNVSVFGTVTLSIKSPQNSLVNGAIGQVALDNSSSEFKRYTLSVPNWINDVVRAGSGGSVYFTVALDFSKPTNCRIDAISPSGAATDRPDRPYGALPTAAQAILPTSTDASHNAPGRIVGTSRVDSSGAFAYEIPIEVPPGRAGMEPHLGFKYSSASANGILGVGWALEGISSIARCRKVAAREGAPDAIKVKRKLNGCSGEPGAVCQEQSPAYDPVVDNFCLDGEKLVLVGGTATSPEFRTERDSFARIVATYPGGGINWPSEFTVWRRDGTIATYSAAGVTSGFGSRDVVTGTAVAGTGFSGVLSWPVGSVADRFGNAVQYNYFVGEQGSAAQIISSIEYTTCAPNSACPYGGATRLVQFSYEARPDYLSHWVAGLTAGVGVRLRSVDVSTENAGNVTAVRSYRMAYETSGATSRSRLASMTLCDGQGICMAPTNFKWGAGKGADFRPSWHIYGPDPETVPAGQCDASNPAPGCFWSDSHPLSIRANSSPLNFLVGDFDGNGTDDFIMLNGSGQSESARLVLTYAPDPAQTIESFKQLPLENADHYYGARAVDIDQDGQTELLLVHRADNSESDIGEIFGYQVLRFDVAVQKFLPVLVELPTPSGQLHASPNLSMLDLNGDGVLDFFFDSGFPQADGHGHAYFSSRALPAANSLAPTAYTTAFPLLYTADPSDQTLYDQNRCRLMPIDFAGHGYSTPGVACADADTSTSFRDMNGDGLADIVKLNHGIHPSATVRLSTGVELAGDLANTTPLPAIPEQQALPVTTLAGSDFGTTTLNFNSLFGDVVTDANGDGLADIVQFRTPTMKGPPVIWLTTYLAPQSPQLTKLAVPYTTERHSHSALQVGDFNGDGLPDIVQGVQFDANTQEVKLQFLIQDPSNRDDVLTQVTSDSVELASVSYTSAPTEHLGPHGYEPAGSFVGLFKPRNLSNIVTQATTLEGGTWETSNYYYTEPAADTHGRGFLGFATVTKANFARGVKTVSLFANTEMEGTLHGYHVFPYAFEPAQVDTETGSAALSGLARSPGVAIASLVEVARSEHQSVVRRLHLLNAPDSTISNTSTYFIEDSGGFHTKTDENGVQFYSGTVSRTYNDFGNVTDLSEVDSAEVTEVHTAFVNDSENWLLSEPLLTATTHKRIGFSGPGDSQTATPQTSYWYWGYKGELGGRTDIATGWRDETYTNFFRDEAGLVRSATVADAFGNERATSVDYSSDGVYPEHKRDVLGHDTWVGYDSGLGVPLVTVDANGSKALYQYDGFARPRSVSAPASPTTTISYAQNSGAVATTVSQAPGTTVTKRFLTSGQLSETTTTIGGQTSLVSSSYDSLGRLRATSTPRFDSAAPPSLTRYFYDNLDNVRLVNKPDDSTITINLLGGLKKETVVTSADDMTKDTVVTMTPDGLLESVREKSPGSAVPVRGVDYVYGQNKRLFQVNELGGPSTTYYTYGLAVPTVVLSSESGRTSLLYDGFNNLQSATRAGGVTETYERDNAGRPTRITVTSPDPAHADATLKEESRYVYDQGPGAVGQISYALSPDGIATRYAYTPEGLLSEKTYDAGADTFHIGFHHDFFGRVDHVDYPETGQPRFSVDMHYSDPGSSAAPDGSLLSVTRGSDTYWSVLSRGPTGIAESAERGTGLTQVLDFDPATRALKGISVNGSDGTEAYDVQYSYYQGGNVKTRTDAVAGSFEQYQYDGYDQLASWARSDATSISTEFYGYDGLGNQNVSGTAIKVFGGNGFSPHQLSKLSVDGHEHSFSYDPLGRQTSWVKDDVTQRSVTYTAFDLPRTVTTTQPTPRTVAYAYDANQHRFSQNDGTATTTYIDDLYERRVDNTTGVTQHVFYIFAEGRRLAQVVQDGTTETTTRLYSDAVGSITGADQGQPASRQAFSPWGNRIPLGNASNATPIASVTTGFTDQEHDDNIGLINMRGRMYDPATRTFLTPDPVVGSALSISGWNKYAYVSNNPLKYVDPSGFETITVYDGKEEEVREQFKLDMTIAAQAPEPTFRESTAPSGSFSPGEDVENGHKPASLGPQLVTDVFQDEWPSGPIPEPAPYDPLAGLRGLGSINLLNQGDATNRGSEQRRELYVEGMKTVAIESATAIPVVGIEGKSVLTLAEAGTLTLEALEVAEAEQALGGSIRNVNPTGGSLNCANCAVATDATLAGNAASALPGGITQAGQLAREIGGSWIPTTGPGGITTIMQNAGPGARGIVFGARGAQLGHFFNVVNQGGAIRFLDGQAGGAANLALGYSNFWLLRTF